MLKLSTPRGSNPVLTCWSFQKARIIRPEPISSTTADRALAGASDPVGKIRFADLREWRKGKQENRNYRYPQSECKNEKVNANFTCSRHTVGSKEQQKSQTKKSEKGAQRSCQENQNKTLSDELLDHTTQAGAEGQSHGKLAMSGFGAC